MIKLVLNNNYIKIIMPSQRKSAKLGEATRRSTTTKYNKLDKVLKRDMGTSLGFYSITKDGKPRVEFYGMKKRTELKSKNRVKNLVNSLNETRRRVPVFTGTNECVGRSRIQWR